MFLFPSFPVPTSPSQESGSQGQALHLWRRHRALQGWQETRQDARSQPCGTVGQQSKVEWPQGLRRPVCPPESIRRDVSSGPPWQGLAWGGSGVGGGKKPGELLLQRLEDAAGYDRHGGAPQYPTP